MTTTPVPLPVAHVSDLDHNGTPVAEFYGEHAIARAEQFIGSLEHAEAGRYGLDVSDDQCPSCEATFSREAWEQYPPDQKWYCPRCGAPDGRSR